MLVWRRYSQRAGEKREKLTDAERAELLREWKETGRAGLVPITDSANGNDDVKRRIGTGVVVEKVHGSKMTILLDANRNTSSSSNSLNSSRRGSPRSKSPTERQRMTVLNFATHDFLGMASSDDGDGVSIADAGAAGPAAATPAWWGFPERKRRRPCRCWYWARGSSAPGTNRECSASLFALVSLTESERRNWFSP